MQFMPKGAVAPLSSLALVLGLCLASCSGEAAEKAKLEAQAAAEAASAKAAQLAESASAAAERASDAAADAAEQLKADVEAAKAKASAELDAAFAQARRYFVDNKDELAVALESRLAELDVEIEALQATLASASEEAVMRTGLLVAAVDAKRGILEGKLAMLRQASEDSWQRLQPELENQLASLEKALDTARTRLDKTVAETGEDDSGDYKATPPKELFEVVKVVDGDTIHIQRGGKVDKLRLLSVDTEEKLSGRPFEPSKPETLFGEEAKLWAIDFFAGLADEDGKTRVGVAFPKGEEAYDVYGRLLCHVILPDGTDFNLKLVEEGWSPYFPKYGYSRICHAAFLEAEARAKAAELGVWSPEVNKPANPADPWHKRDYDRLVPWWHARGEAVQGFRMRDETMPGSVVSAEDPEGLAEAVERSAASGYLTSVFGSVDRTFEESDGSLTLLFRSAGEDAVEFRGKVPQRLRADYAHLALEDRNLGERQNYLYVVGKPVQGERGIEVTVTDQHSVQLGAPDPVYPE
ncbi:MAG: thermonuclease family protein [Planctomycetota bacterium]|nr:thermonuclease family protein [Planctomycetota bacterium]